MILEVIKMLIKEVAKMCDLTKKAVEYYVEQKLGECKNSLFS